uniref:Small ribosomal subunit protein uS11c n=1 Tax=Palmophyllum crassum TaxID=1615899 RepID=A0A1L7NXX3_9VIRI|nr:ribosomal protein S11 [Palmophyllum crassum]BAW34768.1 ribosomal protein S11 [Palmophyllum crassum]
MKKQKSSKKKIKKKLLKVIIHIKASFNNTIITITDLFGNVIGWSSTGICGFKGSRKSTPFAAQMAVENVLQNCSDYGFKQADVIISGPGSGREISLRAIQKSNILINVIRDITPIPHNGCRPPKKRRV